MSFKSIYWAIFCGAVLTGIAAYAAFYTSKGSEVIATKVLSGHTGQDGVDIGEAAGTVAEGLTLRNIELTNLKKLPAGTVLKIQTLFVNLRSLNLQGLHVEVENARLKLPGSEPIVISGVLSEQELNFNVYANGFTVNEIVSYLPDFKKLMPVKGEVAGVDLYIKGHYLEPKVTGNLNINRFEYKGFTLTGSPWTIDVSLKDIRHDVKVSGNVAVRDGNLQAEKSTINRIQGSVNFADDWNQARLNLSGQANIEKTKIQIGLKGTVNRPELNLSSQPPYSRQKLMVMLATGKSWQSVEDTMNTGVVSSDLTKDFIDYFFFAGKSNTFAQKLGLKDVSIKLDKDIKGVEAKKGLTDKLDVGYGVEQTDNIQGQTNTHKIQGEYQVTENISAGVERETKVKQSLDDLDPSAQKTEDDKVYLKYQKSF